MTGLVIRWLRERRKVARSNRAAHSIKDAAVLGYCAEGREIKQPKRPDDVEARDRDLATHGRLDFGNHTGIVAP
jgi:hypothetical protein